MLPQSIDINGRVISGEEGFREALRTETNDEIRKVLEFCLHWCGPDPEVVLHTSGSTGVPKEIHAKKTAMLASARMTVERLGLKAGDTALLCLPMDYIAGQMVVVRALLAGLRVIVQDPSRHPFEGLTESPVFAALVPLQVKASLETPKEEALMRGVRELIIGGAATDDTLAAILKTFPHHVWSTYGMTETLSHVALRPLSGPKAGPWYEPLPGVTLSESSRGTLVISAPAIDVPRIETNDIVKFAEGSKEFRVLGRVDNVIDTGGIKVPAEALEDAIRPEMPAPFAVTWLPDEDLGSAVTVEVESDHPIALPDFRAILKREGLSPFWKPRHAVFVPKIPQTRSGKPDRKGIQRAAAEAKGDLKQDL